MESDLKGLQIDRSRRRVPEPSKWSTRWILIGVSLLALLGVGRLVYGYLTSATEVETVRVQEQSSGAAADPVVLNATGYIVAHHEIEVASKVVGRVAWIGVEKGDHVQAGQVLVRLEDDEYRAQLQQAQGNLANLEARLAEAEHGSRPQEIAQAKANYEQAQADLADSRVTLDRTKDLAAQGVVSKQALDDARSKYEADAARAASLDKAYELVKLGPRQEEIQSLRGQVEQAKGAVAYAQEQLDNTIIRSPVTGTILERAVEKGEFVTNGFVGDKGAKGYVVTLADLNDLQVELDIAQNDFAKLHMGQKGVVTTDAFPDRKYDGLIAEISPKADRQKATVQVKVKVLKPDSYLRPEMNASVAFLSEEPPAGASGAAPQARVVIPQSAVKNNTVYVVLNGRALRRPVKLAGTTSKGVVVEQGLVGGEDLVINPPADLKDGNRVKSKS